MADLKISQLTTWVPLDTDLIPFVDLSWVPVTKKATRADLKGDNWTSATATAWTTTTGVAWTNASVTNSWTTNAAVFDFTIPRGDVGATGTPWADSTVPWPTWNWIASNVLLSTVWLVKTYRITYTDASIFDYTTTDWAAGSGTGDMIATTYDPQAIWADAFNMNNMTESANKKILTSTERSNIVTNNSKISYTDSAAVALNTAKVSDINHVTSELPNVDNTSDANKPVSIAQQTEIDTKEDKTTTINAQTWTTYTLVLTDQSKLVTLTNAAAVTLTIPTNSSVAFPTGTQIDLSQDGVGSITVAGAGVTIYSLDSNKTSNGRYVGLTLIKIATNTWNLYGNLV